VNIKVTKVNEDFAPQEGKDMYVPFVQIENTKGKMDLDCEDIINLIIELTHIMSKLGDPISQEIQTILFRNRVFYETISPNELQETRLKMKKCKARYN